MQYCTVDASLFGGGADEEVVVDILIIVVVVKSFFFVADGKRKRRCPGVQTHPGEDGHDFPPSTTTPCGGLRRRRRCRRLLVDISVFVPSMHIKPTTGSMSIASEIAVGRTVVIFNDEIMVSPATRPRPAMDEAASPKGANSETIT